MIVLENIKHTLNSHILIFDDASARFNKFLNILSILITYSNQYFILLYYVNGSMI